MKIKESIKRIFLRRDRDHDQLPESIKGYLFGDEQCIGIFVIFFRRLKRHCIKCGNKKEFWWCLMCRPCMKISIELMEVMDELEDAWDGAKKAMNKKREEENDE